MTKGRIARFFHPLAYVNRITKGREQIVNKSFVKMMDELGYDVELTYKKKVAD